MKSSDIFDAIGNADEKFVKEANAPHYALGRRMRLFAIPAVAALLAVSLVFGFIFSKDNGEPPPSYKDNDLPQTQYTFPTYTPNTDISEELFSTLSLSSPTIPKRVQYSKENTDEWYNELKSINAAYRNAGVDLNEFMERALPVLLGDNEGESIVCSPINIYIAFAMLAEITEGNSQKEIFTVLGIDSIDTLRSQISTIWETTFHDDGYTKTLLANSIWLSNEEEYKAETILRLAELYFVSTFSGEVGSEEYSKALRQWLNYNTGGLLSDQTKGIEIKEGTVLVIASTILFEVGWKVEFSEKNNTESIFYGTKSNSLCTFMNQSFKDTYFVGKSFSAVRKDFQDQGNIFFILPDEGTTPEELLKSDTLIDFLMESKCKEKKIADINLSVPKFDISSNIDLKEKMAQLGINDVLEYETADFDLLSENSKKKDFLYIGEASHAARVRIDEEGCIGTAYTLIHLYGAGFNGDKPPIVDFVLDRPFIFVVTNSAGIPLFVGIVNQL